MNPKEVSEGVVREGEGTEGAGVPTSPTTPPTGKLEKLDRH